MHRLYHHGHIAHLHLPVLPVLPFFTNRRRGQVRKLPQERKTSSPTAIDRTVSPLTMPFGSQSLVPPCRAHCDHQICCVMAEIQARDIVESLAEVYYPNNPTGFFWHYKVLLMRVDGACSRLDEWKKERIKGAADIRLLGEHYEFLGIPKPGLTKVVAMMMEAVPAGFPVEGDQALKELSHVVSYSRGDRTTYHLNWTRISSVDTSSAVAHIDSNLSEAFRPLRSFGQADDTNSAAAERMARFLFQHEIAVERSLQAPDYTRPDICFGATVSAAGEAIVVKSTSGKADRLGDRVTTMKRDRLYREEFRTSGSSTSSSPLGRGGGGPGDGRPRWGRVKSSASSRPLWRGGGGSGAGRPGWGRRGGGARGGRGVRRRADAPTASGADH